jgi:hypothetical protein
MMADVWVNPVKSHGYASSGQTRWSWANKTHHRVGQNNTDSNMVAPHQSVTLEVGHWLSQ